MAKKKKRSNTSLLRKGIALLASVVTFVFFFLELICKKTKYFNILKDKNEVESTGIKFSEFLFNEEYELVRETFSITTTIMWIVFILAIVSVVFTALALFVKKGTKVSKLGAGLLVLAMVLMFAMNIDKGEVLKVTTWYSNMTALYFVALALSVGGFVSVATLKK